MHSLICSRLLDLLVEINEVRGRMGPDKDPHTYKIRLAARDDDNFQSKRFINIMLQLKNQTPSLINPVFVKKSKLWIIFRQIIFSSLLSLYQVLLWHLMHINKREGN